jgi:hypothetical protein
MNARDWTSVALALILTTIFFVNFYKMGQSSQKKDKFK